MIATAENNKRPDYGIDAPGLMRGFFAAGGIAIGIAIVVRLLLPPTLLRTVLITPLSVVAVYTLGMGCLMIYGSKVYKVRSVTRLFSHLLWRGNEQVLDVGCGGGLLLIEAAKRLTTGRAIGIDVWSSADQNNNKPETGIENARREGVQDRVAMQTADMRQLPFPDVSFDIILSQWAVHNLPNRQDRQAALREMVRTLKSGGQILLVDIANHDEYITEFASLGMPTVKKIGPNLLSRGQSKRYFSAGPGFSA